LLGGELPLPMNMMVNDPNICRLFGLASGKVIAVDSGVLDWSLLMNITIMSLLYLLSDSFVLIVWVIPSGNHSFWCLGLLPLSLHLPLRKWGQMLDVSSMAEVDIGDNEKSRE
jgi:hypothetical protein